MALSGLQIFKMLPKTNCKDCGYPTCMAYALQLAVGKASLDACPHLAPEIAATLAEVSAPAVRRLEFGDIAAPVVLGEETVLYRHEKRFEHAPVLALHLDDSMDDDRFTDALAVLADQVFERVGDELRVQAVVVAARDAGILAERARRVVQDTPCALILRSDDAASLRGAALAAAVVGHRPLLWGTSADRFDDVAGVALELGLPLVVRGSSLDELAGLGQRCLDMGLSQVALDPMATDAREALAAQVLLRRAAVRDRVKALGFPLIASPFAMSQDPLLKTVLASALIAKYAGIVVIDTLDPAHVLPLLALGQGLYTDPQRPMMVEEGLYPIGDPGPDSPVLLTTNFSLTYYTVTGEIANSRVPAWLLVMDVDGLSVLTAWAAGKFVADAIAPFVQRSGVAGKVAKRQLIIPGYVASIQTELEEELGDWEVVVGVREAADISRFLKSRAEVRP